MEEHVQDQNQPNILAMSLDERKKFVQEIMRKIRNLPPDPALQKWYDNVRRAPSNLRLD